MFCKNCGQEISDDSTFCGNCGHPVVAESNNDNVSENKHKIDSTNQTFEKSKVSLKNAFYLAKDFFKNPKDFINSYMSENAVDNSISYAFIAYEIIAGIVFAFVTKSVIKSLVSYYTNMTGYTSAIVSINAMIEPLYNKVFTSLSLWLTVSILSMWGIRYIFAKLVSNSGNEKKLFGIFSVFSSIETIAYLASILYAILLGIFGKFDIKTLIDRIENSSYSSYSSNPFSIFNQYMQSVQSIVGGFKMLVFMLIIFSLVYTLLYIFHIVCMVRVSDNLVETGHLQKKKAKILLIAFAVILILVNMYFGLFIYYKVIKDVLAEGIKMATLYGGTIGSMFGF